MLNGAPVSDVVRTMSEAADRYSEETAALISGAVEDANHGVGPQSVLSRLDGCAAHEAIAAAAYVLARHSEDPRAAILEGANTLAIVAVSRPSLAPWWGVASDFHKSPWNGSLASSVRMIYLLWLMRQSGRHVRLRRRSQCPSVRSSSGGWREVLSCSL